MVTDAVPPGCGRALDAGCGQGFLTRDLAARCREVVALDLDCETPARAKALTDPAARVRFVEGDVMTLPLEVESFDFISAVAMQHHVPLGTTHVGAPIKDPVETIAEIRTACAAVLPGATFRRHMLFRYSVIWRKPVRE